MRSDHPIFSHRRALEATGARAPWVALFDIDSTLMDTGPRNASILAEALDGIPGLAVWKNRLDLSGRSWNVLDPLKKAGVTDQHLLGAVAAFWKDRFFTDEWVLRDKAYAGAAEFVAGLKAAGFRIAYLTGRHASGMEAGTRESFAQHGLPCGPEETFFFKPTFEMDDRDFKESVCDHVAALGTLVVTVDNEPANVNLFRRRFPQAQVVWLDTVTSPAPEPLAPGIVTHGPEYFLDR